MEKRKEREKGKPIDEKGEMIKKTCCPHKMSVGVGDAQAKHRGNLPVAVVAAAAAPGREDARKKKRWREMKEYIAKKVDPQ